MQYIGGSLAGYGIGKLVDLYGWGAWAPSMIGFCRRRRRAHAGAVEREAEAGRGALRVWAGVSLCSHLLRHDCPGDQ